ncbi:hypothetical protein FA95DRAFT_1611156 [Auriscalpium vulgare]|uniref:Uncharacterized protein n=1 Tax=Auriscalpium vulgare TaxID=40419 RepID=A0ACB8RCC8_9AGAM|nr:hypothetical protein FA95DRAFT_1611156 [Auriscalpium vulgare]
MSLFFMNLPDELLHTILLELDYRSILSCQRTCRKIKNVVDNSINLQYKIELGASAMCEGPGARHLSAVSKLERLREYKDTRAGPIRLEELPFVPALVSGSATWNIHTSVTTLVSSNDEDDGLSVYVQQMPSAARGIEERHWSVTLGAAYRVAAVDASQDLLVVQESEDGDDSSPALSMLALSTGGTHPDTVAYPGRLVPRLSEGDKCGRFEVFGDYCAAICVEREGQVSLIVWKWRTWSADVQISPSAGPAFTIFSRFMFIDSAHIAILVGHPPVISVYAFDTEKTEYLPTNFVLPPNVSLRPKPVLIQCADVASTDHPGIFHPSPSRILSLIFSLPMQPHQFRLNVPVGTLLAHMQAAPTTVQWADWGPAGSRMVPYPFLRTNLTRSAMQMIALAPNSGEQVALLLDYHPLRVARARSRGAGGLVEKAFEVADGSISGLVTTTLPYLERKFTFPWVGDTPYQALVCEDQLFVFEESVDVDDPRLFVRAWACAV